LGERAAGDEGAGDDQMRDGERCMAMVMSGGRGYVEHRCGKRAVSSDPDQLCRTHRLEQDGHQALDPQSERLIQIQQDMERRLHELTGHLQEFYALRADIEYDSGVPGKLCTGRLLVDPHELLRVLHAQDLMPVPRRAG
jgi:hypothetical protein